jgi:hypothetical protein
MTVTPEQINAAQGTRLEEKAPWETYSESLDEKLSPELEAAVAEYATHVHEGESSNQTKEEYARWKEMNDASVDEYKWCTAEEYKDIQTRMGKILHASELISMLRLKLGIKCWYRAHPHVDKLTLLVQRGDGMIPPEIGCWVQNGYMPEYTVMGFDAHGVPLAEKYRGWRTVLLQLIIKGITTEEKAHKVFGPAERSCADRYNSILYGVRNTMEA